jgi:lambda repressor-like predicted transcriptional regulator
MQFDSLPNPARDVTYIRQRIDPRNDQLIRQKLELAGSDLRKDIRQARTEIYFANRLNLNKTGIENAVGKMWEEKVDEYVKKCYELLCHHWNLIGEPKTSTFVTVVSEILVQRVMRIGASAANSARMRRRRNGALGMPIAPAHVNPLQVVINKWKTKWSIEAKEMDLIDARPHTRRHPRPVPAIQPRPIELPAPIVEGLPAPRASVVIHPAGTNPKGRRLSVIKPLLEKKGWSMNDWAVQSSVDFHTVDNYLKGRSKPYPSTRHKLAKSLGIEPDKLPS